MLRDGSYLCEPLEPGVLAWGRPNLNRRHRKTRGSRCRDTTPGHVTSPLEGSRGGGGAGHVDLLQYDVVDNWLTNKFTILHLIGSVR